MGNIPPFTRYLQLEGRLKEARDKNDELLEDQILDEMDTVWELLSDQERASLEENT